VMQFFLARVVAPLDALSMRLAQVRATQGGDIVEPSRYGLFSDLAARADQALRIQTLVVSPPSHRPAPHGDAHAAFLRSVSHELRTPLNAILGFTELLLGELDGPLSREQRDNLGIVRDSGQKLTLLVTDMIDVAALASGESMRARTTVDLSEVLDQVREAALERRGMRLVHVRVDVTSGAEHVVVERETLLRVLRILTEYVLERTQSGEVSLLCERTAPGAHVLRLQGDGLLGASEELSGLQDTTLAPGARPKASRMRLAIAKELLLLLEADVEIERNPAQEPVAIVLRLPAGEAL
jgi:signal transduction histidine kinase